jgi:phenylalanine-4-hydroxylase
MQAQATPVKVKHGLAAGPAAAPQRADWTIDQGWDNYTPGATRRLEDAV